MSDSSMEFAVAGAGAAVSRPDGVVLDFVCAQSRLEIVDGTLCFELTKPPPNRWWQFWQKALLGWHWIDLRKADV